MTGRIVPLFLMFLLLSVAPAHAQSSGPVTFGHSEVTITTEAGAHYHFTVEVAQTSEQMEQGLMFREKMAPGHGMVFVFPEQHRQCMWMKNTLIPLSVAFIDNDGKIINIEEMQAQTTNNHCGKKLVRYALEMNQGWFKHKNIQPGSSIEGLALKR